MKTLLLAEFGSRAYGTDNEFSDTDLVKVVLEPREYITGLGTFSTTMNHTAEDGERSTKDDTDTTVYGLQKFAQLAVDGNPSIMAVLYLPDDFYEDFDPRMQPLMNLDAFVSKNAGKKHLGYMVSQRMAMTGERNKRTNRPELVNQFGFDTKFAGHYIRLGLMGIELMRTGTLTLPMAYENARLIKDIRAGKFTKDEVLLLGSGIEEDLKLAIDSSTYPEFGDKEAVSKVLHDIYMDEWSKA